MPLADQQEEDDETDMSLITGALRSQNLLVSEPTESSCGSSVVLRNQTLTVANTNSAGMRYCLLSFPCIHMFIAELCTHTVMVTPCACKHFSKQQLHLLQSYESFVLHYTFILSLFSIISVRTKLAWLRAEVGRDTCGEGSEGQEGHSYCL